MINIYLWIRGKRRIRHGYCPKCNSSPPDFECTVCRGDDRYGTNVSRTQQWLWARRYKFYLKHRKK